MDASSSKENDVVNDKDWAKPQAMAIPKEGYFSLEKVRSDLSQNTGVPWVHDHREDQAWNRGRNPELWKEA
jgi:hypothetical protein